MRLTQFSNYAVRTLIYAGLKGHHPSGVPEISRAYGISQNHLNKVAAELCHLGYLQMTRGRTGGVQLGMAPEMISIGDVIRNTESTVSFVECFESETNTCPLRPECKFRIALQGALGAFFAELNRHTLADFLVDSEKLGACLGITRPTVPEDRPYLESHGCKCVPDKSENTGPVLTA
jgi:Rrf2 family transcriptional regulator, nitric oxide-sensitive transcriptional repressor